MPDVASPNLQAHSRTAEQELSILTELGQILSSTLELRDTFGKMMQIISDKLNMHRGTLVLLDESTGRVRTEAAVGLTSDEMERGKYALGEGITGNVVATGRPRIVADVRKEPDFLNRTGRFNPATDEGQTSFLCVPIKIEGRTTGALSVDKPFGSEEQLRNDYRFLDIVSAFLSQAIQINRMVMRQKEVLLEENAQLRAQVRDRYRFENIIGDSPAMHEVFATVGQVANSRATVLLLGETGTGKEMIAKAIHYNSPRKDKPFVRVNCGAMTTTLLESELFGHVKGSFTGAINDKIGRFEAADGGSIFLDEIGTMEPQLQVKLLRVLQERELERAVVLSGGEDFNEDLLPLSVRMFAAQRRTNQASESIETLTRRLADQAIADYELREGEIYALVIDQIERALIDRALAKCGGIKTKAADFLGINRNTLNKKVKDLGIEAVE